MNRDNINSLLADLRHILHSTPGDEAWEELKARLFRASQARVELDAVLKDYLRSQIRTNWPRRYGPLLEMWLVPGGAKIPAGRFWMGSGDDDPEAYDWEKPRREVKLSRSFVMQRTPVTQGQWEAVMGTNPSLFNGDERPVESVSWYDAVAFCNGLSQREGFEHCYETARGEVYGASHASSKEEVVFLGLDARGWRLPTEAEWEYACRAGSTDVRYGPLDEIAWWRENSGGETHPVGTKRANAWGLYDTIGNVWEWCWDVYGPYNDAELLDPTGPESGSFRVLRGGCWGLDDPADLRAANRSYDSPGGANSLIGLRCARSFH